MDRTKGRNRKVEMLVMAAIVMVAFIVNFIDPIRV